MDAESAARGRYFHFSRPSELAPTADRVANLPLHAHVSRGRSDFVARDGQGAVVNDAHKAAGPLSDVLILRAIHEATQIHAPSLTRVSGKDRRNI